MNMLFILLGTSGSGKTALTKMLTTSPQSPYFVQGLSRVITTTTRAIRPEDGEVQGQAYWFRTREEFEEDWTSGDLLERAEYKDNHYGLRKSDVHTALTHGDGIVLMESQGAHIMVNWKPDAHLIHLAPLPESILRDRMKKRGDAKEVIAHRLQGVEAEKSEIARLACIYRNTCELDNSGTLEATAVQAKQYIESVRRH